MMARLEDAGLVEGSYRQKVIDGQLLKQRHYRVRPAGARAWSVTRDFYLPRLRAVRAMETVSG